MRSPALIVLIVLTACTGLTGTTTTSAGTSSSTMQPPSTTSSPSSSTSIALDGCPEDEEFVQSGQVARVDQPTSDTRILGRISWQAEGLCERFALDFETDEGAPATTPPSVAVEFLPSGRILRIHLGLETTVVADQLVETSLVERLYVVRALDGGMFVDLHLRSPAQARASVRNSPAALNLELQMGIQPFSGLATIGEDVVVVEPAPGAETGRSVGVRGYARTFEANVLVIVTSDGETSESTTQAADWVETWGEFRTTVELPVGPSSLFIGEESPEDGSLQGVTVLVTAQ
jgi:hypothetical protein